MYRVVTKYRDRGHARPTVERGPWHPTRDLAEQWAEVLRHSGYVVEVESQGAPVSDNSDLAAALASMA